MANKSVKLLHDLADRLGRQTGYYIPEVKVIEIVISEIGEMQRRLDRYEQKETKDEVVVQQT